MNLFSNSSYVRSISWIFRMARDLCVFPLIHIDILIVYVVKKMCVRSSLTNPPSVFAHGNSVFAAITMSTAMASVPYLLASLVN